MGAQDPRLFRPSVGRLCLSCAAVAIAAGLPLICPSGASADKCAAIRKAGAKWIARPTDAERPPGEALCGLVGEPAFDPSRRPPSNLARIQEEPPAFWDWRTQGVLRAGSPVGLQSSADRVTVCQ